MKILTGFLKGRAISFRPQPGLRPTPDKVRKAVIDAFAGWIEGKKVLDLYSGTGAFGFELLSAGAGSVLFVEREGLRAKLIKEWLAEAKLSTRSAVRAEESFRACEKLAADGERFDLAILDPPYDDPNAFKILGKLGALVVAGGFVVYECRAKNDGPGDAHFERVRDKIYGETRLIVYRKIG